MSNTCTNKLLITGDSAFLNIFIQDNLGTVNSDGTINPIDFSKSVPVPDAGEDTVLWKQANWGTRYVEGILSAHEWVTDSTEPVRSLIFTTVDAPPFEWLATTSGLYPELNFLMRSINPGNGSYYIAAAKNNEAQVMSSAYNHEELVAQYEEMAAEEHKFSWRDLREVIGGGLSREEYIATLAFFEEAGELGEIDEGGRYFQFP